MSGELRQSEMRGRYPEFGRSLAMGALIGVTVALIFSAGFFLRELMQIPALATDGRDYPLLNEVSALIDRHFVRTPPDETALEYGAIRGMLGALADPNTYFIDPPVAQSESDVLAGTYGGIGVTLQRSADGTRYLLYPYDDSPARAAGIQNGAQLIAINEMDITTTIQQDAVDQLMRGEVKDGSGVTLRAVQPDGSEFAAFIAFDIINVPSVFWRIVQDNPKVGYVQIVRFTNRTPSELETGLQEMDAAGIDGLILDLRSNGGGLFRESLAVADQFLESGVALYERTRNAEKTYETENGGLYTAKPLVVLVNNGTASASELVAGALRDRERATLIGQRTYGKGTIQQIFALSDSSSVHITSAEWYTPDQVRIDGSGLEPDILTTPDASGRDVELSEALQILSQQDTP
jgi:carboxyl-terminal processing protease